MKLTILLLTVGFLNVAANGISQTVTYSGTNVSLQKVLVEIEQQTGYSFFYKEELLTKVKPITIDVQNYPLETFLKEILKEQQLVFSIENRNIIISGKLPVGAINSSALNLPPPIKISGTIIGMNKQPLSGATIRVKGKSISTTSDDKGNFELNAESGSTLIISYVGFYQREFKVLNENIVTIDLRQVDKTEKEVIISTGYEKVNKERFVGSYSQLDSANYHRRAGMGILERLEGTVNGVLFDKKGAYNSIQIRGISSLGAEDPGSSLLKPLIVVDNFPMDSRFGLENINPNDVENITVLKDAAATSIWGARAGNGVIVVSTKKGKYNRSMQINLSSNVTLESKPNLFYVPRISSNDFIDIERELFEKGFYEEKIEDVYTWPVLSPVVEILIKKRNDELSEKEADDQINSLRDLDVRDDLNRFVYRPSFRQQHFLGLNGGTNIFNYNLSFGFNAASPNIKGAKASDQFTLNSSAGFQPTKNLEIQASINYGQSKSRTVPFATSLDFPYLKLADENNSALAIPYRVRTSYLDSVSAPGLFDWRYRPLDEIRISDYLATVHFIDLNLSVSYKFANWLHANVSYQYLTQMATTETLNSIEAFSTRYQINQFYNPTPNIDQRLAYPIPVGGVFNSSVTESGTKNGRATVNFNRSFSTHQVMAMVGAEISETKGDNKNNQLYGYDGRNGSYVTNMDFLNYYPQTFAAYEGAYSRIINDEKYNFQPLNRFLSFFGNASYTYNNKYTVYASARRDGANVFGVNANNRWKPLWSVGTKWQISRENFFRTDWIQALSLRASYGLSGNVNNASSGKLTMYYDPVRASLSNLLYGYPVTANNPDLRWEKVGQFNLGTDFSILQQRLSGSIDFYSKKSIDVIANYPFDPSTGLFQYAVNSASLKGTGFDINVNSVNLNGKIGWTTSLGFSHSRTIVGKIFKGGFKASDFLLYQLNPSEGKLAYSMSSYKWAGLDPVTGDPQGYFDGKISKDYNAIFNDSIQNQVYNGSAIPLYMANLGNSVKVRGWTLSFLIIGRFDYYYRKPALNIRHSGSLGGVNYISDYYQRWQKTGDEKSTNVPSVIFPIPSNVLDRDQFYTFSEINVLRADNIKLQDIRLQYEWMNKKNSKNPVKSAQFYFYPNNLNLIIWRADTSSLDPDYGGTSSNPTTAPPARTWTVGFNLNF